MARAQGLASYVIRRSLLPSQSPYSSLPRSTTAILLHFTSFSTSSSSSCNGSRFFSPTCHLPFSSRPLSLALAGAVSFSVAASTFSTEAALAKEPISADRLPRNVVLYQYEACPFCNKVKALIAGVH